MCMKRTKFQTETLPKSAAAMRLEDDVRNEKSRAAQRAADATARSGIAAPPRGARATFGR